MYGFVDMGSGINEDSDDLPHATYALVFFSCRVKWALENAHWLLLHKQFKCK